MDGASVAPSTDSATGNDASARNARGDKMDKVFPLRHEEQSQLTHRRGTLKGRSMHKRGKSAITPRSCCRSRWRRSVTAVLLCYSCAMATEGARVIAPGTWGGDHVILELTASGGELEFDCARGHLDDPVRVDANGQFDVKGTFIPEHPGPVRRDERRIHSEARYTGQVTGDKMTLKVRRGDSDLGSFTLARGARPLLKKCR